MTLINQVNGDFNTINTVAELHAIGIRYNEIFGLQDIESQVELSSIFSTLNGSIPVIKTDENESDFKKRLRTWFDLTLQDLFLAEESIAPEKDQSLFRELLSNNPLLANLYGSRGSQNDDIFFSRGFPPASTSENSRQRTFHSVPISCLVFLVSHFLAFDIDMRRYLNDLGVTKFLVPSIVNELQKCVRRSRAKHFLITPVIEGFDDYTLDLLGLKKTIFDFKFLKTHSGQQALTSLFSTLACNPKNYIKFAPCEIVPFDSGYQTTRTAISIESISSSGSYPTNVSITNRVTLTEKGPEPSTKTRVLFDPLYNFTPRDCVISVLPGHSYPVASGVHAIHATDALVFGQSLIDRYSPDRGNKMYVSTFSSTVQASMSKNMLTMYIAKRGIGIITNSNNTVFDEELKTTREDKEQAKDIRPVRVPKKNTKSSFTSQVKEKFNKGARPASKFIKVILSLFDNNQLSKRVYTRLMYSLI